MATSYLSAGIDVSKDELELAFHGQKQTQRFKNNEAGIADLVECVRAKAPTYLALEATGGYQRSVVAALHAGNLPVSVCNPKRVRHFAQGAKYLAKTDRLDALALAHFAHAMTPACDEKPDQNQQKRAELVKRRRQLIKMRSAESKRLKQTAASDIAEDIEQTIEMLDQKIKRIEKQLDQAMAQDQTAQQQSQTLQNVQGVGPQLAKTLTNEVPELGRCSRKRIAALIGVAPFNCDSGQMRGKRMIRGGRSEVRSVLYMATLAACRFNPVIRQYYEHLISQGKAFKVAIVACMRKLLTHLNNLAAEIKNPPATT